MFFWTTGGRRLDDQSLRRERGAFEKGTGAFAGNAGHAGAADSGDGGGAWTHDCACYRAHVGRCAADRAGVAVSSAAPAGGSRLGPVLLGREREQPEGAVLQVDSGGAEAAEGGDAPLERDGGRDWPGAD